MAGLFWWEADKGTLHSKVFEHVIAVESVQSDIFERFLKLATLYDPYDRNAVRSAGGTWSGPESNVSENVCASGVDTISAIISGNQPRARFMTDDGNWSEQRRARELERYAEGLAKLLDIHLKGERSFKDAAIKGTGFVKVTHDGKKRICVERVPVDEIVVDEGECTSGQPPRQMHQRKIVDRTVLVSKFPQFRDEINRAQTSGSSVGRIWCDYRPLEDNQIAVVESWVLPVGEKPDDYEDGQQREDYEPGRHAITVDGADLEDEEYHKAFFPLAKLVFSERQTGYYGISAVERVAGHQRALNKLNWQHDRQLDQVAFPTTYIRPIDSKIAVGTTNRAGTFVVYKGDVPQTHVPPAIGAESYQRRIDIKIGALEELGVSRMQAQAKVPGGFESGAAVREFRAATTERFAPQEKAYERHILEIIWLALDCAKDLGAKAPVITRKAKHGRKKIKWPDVDMGEVRVQMTAASQLSRTPAGRLQFAAELVERGLVTADEYRRMLQHPDIEGALSLYTAAYENVERCIEEILDGETIVPEPYQNLQMIVWRGQHNYLKARDDGAPEEILENLRTFIMQAAYVLKPPMAPGAVPGGEDVPLEMGAMPVQAPAEPALAPSAVASMR